MRTAVAGDEEKPRSTGNIFNRGTTVGGTTGAWSTVYVTTPAGFAKAQARSYHNPNPGPPRWPPPGPRTMPAPEPFPDGPLRWECTRLDRRELPDAT